MYPPPQSVPVNTVTLTLPVFVYVGLGVFQKHLKTVVIMTLDPIIFHQASPKSKDSLLHKHNAFITPKKISP